MTKLVVCETMLKPKALETPSGSMAGVTYTTFASTIWSDAFCTCPGFQFHGACKHIAIVEDGLCDFRRPAWDGETIKETLSVPCPQCGDKLASFVLEPEFD